MKSRMHVADKSEQHLSMIQGFNKILKNEGWAGLYKGELLAIWLLLESGINVGVIKALVRN